MENGVTITYENITGSERREAAYFTAVEPEECQYHLCYDVPSPTLEPRPSVNPTINCTIGNYRNWGEWSSCTGKCGGRIRISKTTRKRVRECRPESACEVNGPIILENCGVAKDGKAGVDIRECPACPGPTGGWGSWLPWTTTCVDNIQTRKRKRNCYLHGIKFKSCFKKINGVWRKVDEEESQPKKMLVSPETCGMINRKEKCFQSDGKIGEITADIDLTG